MTTIVYSAGVVAGDSRAIRNGTIMPESVEKVWRVEEHGGVAALVGEISLIHDMQQWLDRGQKAWEQPKIPDGTLVMEFLRDGTIREYTTVGVCVMRPARGFYAWGSGADTALGALAAGCSARRTLEIVMEFDPGTGGEIHVLRVVKATDEEDGA